MTKRSSEENPVVSKDSRESSRVRLVDIAEIVGVSRWTAGQVLNTGRGNSRVARETADRIREVAKELNYRPSHAAITLRSNRSRTFGVMVASAGDPLCSFLVQYLDSEAIKIGRHALLANTVGDVTFAENQFDNVLDVFISHQVDGVFCAVHPWFPGNRHELVQRFPATIFYEYQGMDDVPHVTVDREAAMELAVDHLVGRGRKRIGLAVESVVTDNGRIRFSAWKNALKKHGLSTDASLCFSVERINRMHAVHDDDMRVWDFPTEELEPVVDRLVMDRKVDSLIVQNDFWAAAMIKLLRRRNIRVPGDVAIVGFLNHYLADWVDPPLTTIDPNHHQAARVMVETLEERIAQGSFSREKKEIFIKPKLIVRQST